MGISRFFVGRPIFAWVVAIVIMLAGVLALRTLPISQYPQIAPTTVQISANYPGADAATVENSVTKVIEQGMTGLVSAWLAAHHAPQLVADDYQLVASPEHVLVVPVRAGFVCPGAAMVSLPREIAVSLFTAMLDRARNRA